MAPDDALVVDLLTYIKQVEKLLLGLGSLAPGTRRDAWHFVGQCVCGEEENHNCDGTAMNKAIRIALKTCRGSKGSRV